MFKIPTPASNPHTHQNSQIQSKDVQGNRETLKEPAHRFQTKAKHKNLEKKYAPGKTNMTCHRRALTTNPEPLYTATVARLESLYAATTYPRT